MYKIILTKQVYKELPKVLAARLDVKINTLIDLLKINPFQNPPSYEKLLGDLSGLYSRRINIKHRLVYFVDEANHIVKIVSVWSHYENI